MTETGELVSLADKEVWIIDDDIPINLVKFDIDDILAGNRPIDRGTLLALLSYENWPDDPVKTLCTQLVREAKNVTAFTQPVAAIKYLSLGILVPDVIIYDLVYRNLPTNTDSKEYLTKLLGQCVSVVQVYTQEPVEEAILHLGSLLEFSSRLGSPQNKGQVDVGSLAQIINTSLKKSLSVQLATKIRRSSLGAIEDVLVRIDTLPLNVAVRLLAGETETPEELDLVELLSVKVSEGLAQRNELAQAVRQYATDKGVPEERINEIVQETIALLVANVRQHICYNEELFNIIKSAWEAARQGSEKEGDETTQRIVREFFAFRLYAQPKDDLVRTGDLIALPENTAQDPPDLYLVITPPCDLARFWKKTRGRITLARLCPATRGVARAKSCGNSKFKAGSSITAQHPMVLPSVPLSQNGHVDYVLFPHEIQFLEFENSSATEFQRPLTYTESNGKITKCCHVSEPFLAGILAELSSVLFRPGIPDYPDEEEKRLKGLF